MAESRRNDPEMIAVAIGMDAGVTPIQAAREYRGLTRVQLAEQAGTTIETIISLDEGAEPDQDLLDELARILDVPADLLIDG